MVIIKELLNLQPEKMEQLALSLFLTMTWDEEGQLSTRKYKYQIK